MDTQPENKPTITHRKSKLTPEMEAAQWKPGQSGNPGGRPKKKPISEMYEEIVSDPETMALFKAAVIKAVASGRMSSMFQLKEMADRVEGKVKEDVDMTIRGDVGSALEAVRKRKRGGE